jgi:thioester reductase-like protein
MRPSAYEVLEALPLTANGKVDRAALAARRPDAMRPEAAPHAPGTPQEERLLAIWRGLLPGARLGLLDSFFDAGGHSLLAVRMLARVQREFGREVPLGAWLEQPTVAHLAALLADAGPAAHTDGGDLRALRDRARLADDVVVAAPRTIEGTLVLTGASGLIGSRVAAALLAATDRPMVCLLRDPRRAPQLVAAIERALPRPAPGWTERLRVVQGDLAEPRFGLDSAAFDDLARAASCVFHVGAHVNLVAPYEVLAPANVGGTHEAIRLAARAGAVLCHVSSIGVMPYGAGQVLRENAPLPETGRLLTGYCQTKWVAEQLVAAAARRGLRTVVFRPGLTVGEQAPAAERDLLASVLALSRVAGCLPASDMPVDLVDAGYAAAAIARIGLASAALGKTFHLTHPRPRRLRDLAAALDTPLPLRPFTEWQASVAAQAATLPDGRLAAVAALIAQHDEADITPADVDCSQTEALLAGSGIACPEVEALLARSFQEAGAPCD